MIIREAYLTRIEVPLRHAYVSSRGVRRHYIKTVVRLTADEGAIGYGETDGSDDVFRRACELASGLKSQCFLRAGAPDVSHFRKFRTAPVVDRIAVGGLEMACWDLLGQALGQPVCRLLGGRHRNEVGMVCEFSAGPFANDASPNRIDSFFADLRNIDRLLEAAQQVVERDGYRTLKLKSVGRDADWDVQAMQRLREAFGPRFRLRHDPNGAYSVNDAIALCRRLDGLGLQWFEDPTSGLEGLREVRGHIDTPVATNMWAIAFDQLKRAMEIDALDVVGIDPFHWAGLASAREAAALCQASGLGIFLHCFFDLGLTTAAMLHLAASIEELPNGMDTCLYLQGTDVVQGGEFRVKNGRIRVPDGPGLGIIVDETALRRYELDKFVVRF